MIQMLEPFNPAPKTGDPFRVGIMSTYPPTRCGIARFTCSFVDALSQADPKFRPEVIRLTHGADATTAGEPVSMEIDPNSAVSMRAAARHLNRCDVVILQHEFGIFGDEDGSSVLDLVGAVEVPTITVLHTVLPQPTNTQRRVLESMAAESAVLIALCRSAADLLSRRYSIAADTIEVIRHGAHWSPQPVNHQPRRNLITWGLLGPGKGLEQSIEAVARLRDIDPPLRYQIVGRTHPSIVERDGFSYRNRLEGMVREMDLSDVVEFIDRYVEDDELLDMVRRADIVVVPYLNNDQVSSGVITEAIACGRPVVATRFPYSEEMLASGAGVVTEHNVESIQSGIRALLEDPSLYMTAAREAAEQSERLSWITVADEYTRLIRSLTPARATA